MRDRQFGLWLLVPTTVVILGIWFTKIPLGIPGEWKWERIGPPTDMFLTLLLAVPVAALYVGFSWLGTQRIGRCRRVERGAWLAGLLVAGFVWLSTVQECAPANYRLSKIAWVLYFPGSTGYFTEVRDPGTDLTTFLASYEEKMAEGDVLHVGTHPPGLFVVYSGLLEACRRSAPLTHALLVTQPLSLRDAFDVIEENMAATATPLLKTDRAALWAIAVLTQFAVMLTVIPLYGLLRRRLEPRAAWLASGLWPAVPAVALFLPKSDNLYPLLGCAFLWCWLSGWDRRRALLCLLAGVLSWLGLFFSLAILPVLLLAGALTLWEAKLCCPAERIPDARRRFLFGSSWAAVGFLVPTASLWILADVNLFHVWFWNYRNHAAFYDQFSRSYLKWLLINPIEFAVAAGVPLAVAGLLAAAKSGARSRWARQSGLYWACSAVWILLLVSGKNMGEVARLWIVTAPWLVWMAGSCFSAEFEGVTDVDFDDDGVAINDKSLRRWAITLTLQLLVSLVLVMRTHGFHIPDGEPTARRRRDSQSHALLYSVHAIQPAQAATLPPEKQNAGH